MKRCVNITQDPRGLQLRGCKPTSGTFCGRRFEDNFDVIPKRDWKKIITEIGPSCQCDVSRIKDQGSEGSCASNATAQAFEIAWVQAQGHQNWLEMSPMSIYRNVARTAQGGSTLDDNLTQVSQVGVLPGPSRENEALLKAHGYDATMTHPLTGFRSRFKDGWKRAAKLFLGLEWFKLRTFEEMATALLSPYPVVYGRSGHAICGVALVLREGEICVKYANSWTPSWGDSGYGYDTERWLRRRYESYGAFALRATTLFHTLS